MVMIGAGPLLVNGPARPVWQDMCLPFLFPRPVLPLVLFGRTGRMGRTFLGARQVRVEGRKVVVSALYAS